MGTAETSTLTPMTKQQLERRTKTIVQAINFLTGLVGFAIGAIVLFDL